MALLGSLCSGPRPGTHLTKKKKRLKNSNFQLDTGRIGAKLDKYLFLFYVLCSKKFYTYLENFLFYAGRINNHLI
jgi:hypothetical protein